MTVDGGGRHCRTPEQRVAAKSIVLISALSFIAGCSQGDATWFTRYIPAQIEIGEPIAIKNEIGGLLESCGVVVYRLRHEAIERINADGLHFFDDATTGREDKATVYTSWQSTPPDLPLKEPGIGIDLLGGLLCAREDFPEDLLRTIEKSIALAGSFYATTHEASLFVFPRLGMVVFIHFG